VSSRTFVPLLVVDASVAAKWYLKEELSEEAARVIEAGARGEARLLAPVLLAAELGNVLWQRYRRKELSVEEIRDVWAAFEAAPLTLVEIERLMPTALEIAVGCDCTVYDALYVALVEAYAADGAVLVTADRRLLRQLAGTPFDERVRGIGSLSGE
jgi:predicted nucleic acid-binding protein